jgi:ribulose-5-phosphate 4-epimerase/fuculose-1-phosphate aldolase
VIIQPVITQTVTFNRKAEDVTQVTSPLTRPVRDEVDDAEWEARVTLAACYRLVAHYGMTDMIYNHISLRVPGHPDQFLLNPYGVLYEEMTASMLYKIDLDGQVVLKPDLDYGYNKSGHVIHGAVLQARPDVNCVIHTHARASEAVSTMSCGLLPITQHAMRFYGHVAYHDYDGPALTTEEQAPLARNLGDKNLMILRNHGLLVCGPSVPQAFNTLYWAEMACKAQIDAMAAGAGIIIPDPAVCAETAHLYQPETRRPYGELEWGAMLRLLERKGADYAR